MKARNVHPLFDHVHTVTLDDTTAAEFAKKSGAPVKPGDELRTYLDKNGLAAQAILSRQSNEGAVAYSSSSGFLWGILIEAADKSFIVGEGNPCVLVDLSDLRYWFQEYQ